jgi:hypothetical protein
MGRHVAHDGFEAVRRILGEPRLSGPPRGWIERAERWLEAQEARHLAKSVRSQPRGIGLRGAWRTLRAALVLDSLTPGMALAGIRAPRSSSSRQLGFSSRHASVQLVVSPGAGASSEIRGLFVPLHPEIPRKKVRAILVVNGQEKRVPVTATGEFRFARVPGGQARVRVEWDGARLVLQKFRLDPSAAN